MGLLLLRVQKSLSLEQFRIAMAVFFHCLTHPLLPPYWVGMMLAPLCVYLQKVWGASCCCSVTKLYRTLCDPMDCSMPGFSVFHYLPEFAQIPVRQVGDAIKTSHLLPRPSFASTFPSIRVFFSESALHIRWPKYWIFSFNISHSSEYSGLIFFRNDWFDLLSAQGTLKSFL